MIYQGPDRQEELKGLVFGLMYMSFVNGFLSAKVLDIYRQPQNDIIYCFLSLKPEGFLWLKNVFLSTIHVRMHRSCDLNV